MFDYPVNLEPQPNGGFVVTFPDIPEAITQGEDREEALLYAVDALETALSFYVDSRRALPVPSKAKRGQLVVQSRPDYDQWLKDMYTEQIRTKEVKKPDAEK